MTGSQNCLILPLMFRSLVIAVMTSIVVLMALPQGGHAGEGEGTVRMLPQAAPDGFLIEGRYAEGLSLRLVKSEPLAVARPAHQMPAF